MKVITGPLPEVPPKIEPGERVLYMQHVEKARVWNYHLYLNIEDEGYVSDLGKTNIRLDWSISDEAVNDGLDDHVLRLMEDQLQADLNFANESDVEEILGMGRIRRKQ